MSVESNQVTDNNAPQEIVEPTPQTTPQDDFAGKKHMAAEITKLRAELEQQKQAQQEAQEAAKRKQLEEQDRWKEIASDSEAKLKAAQDAHAAEVRRLTLEAGFAGIQDEFAREGVIAKCPPDADPREYIAEIKDKHPELLNPISADPATRTAAQGLRSGSGGTDWSKVKADMNSRNPALVNPAIEKYETYVRENHKKPPGWD